MPINDPDSPFGQTPTSWEEEDISNPAQTISDPSQQPITPDDDSNALAQQWMGQMTRIGPELYIEDKTASLLSALKALGLPMGSQQEVLFVASLMVDPSILTDDISWFNQGEWAHLLNWLGKLSSKISYTISMSYFAQVLDPSLELLKSLKDLQFEISPNSPKTQSLLKLISGSHSQSAPIAQQILAMDPASMAKLLGQADAPEHPPISPQQPPSGQSELQNVMRKHHPEYGMPQQAPVVPQPPAQSSNPEIRMTMPEVNQYGVDDVPSSIQGDSAQAKNKQIADFTLNYEKRNIGLPPDVKPAPYGNEILRQYVFAPGTSKKNGLANVKVTGGMLLKDLKNGLDAQAIGLAPGGLLAVRLWPSGKYDVWDLSNPNIEKSNIKPPPRD